MMTRDPAVFISKNRREWDAAIIKMFAQKERKTFFKQLKKMTKYNAAKEATFATSVEENGVVITDPKQVAKLVIRDVLLHDSDKAPVTPLRYRR